MDHEEYFLTRVEWRVAVPSGQGNWPVDPGKGRRGKDREPFDWWQIQDPAPATSEARLVIAGVRIVRDWQRLLRRLIGVCVCACVCQRSRWFEWVLDGSRWSNGDT